MASHNLKWPKNMAEKCDDTPNQISYLKFRPLFLELIFLQGHSSQGHHQGGATAYHRLRFELPLLREYSRVGRFENEGELHAVSR